MMRTRELTRPDESKKREKKNGRVQDHRGEGFFFLRARG